MLEVVGGWCLTWWRRGCSDEGRGRGYSKRKSSIVLFLAGKGDVLDTAIPLGVHC